MFTYCDKIVINERARNVSIMNYVIMAGAFIIAAIGPTVCILKKNGKVESAFIKGLSIALFCVYFIHCFTYDSNLIHMTLKEKVYSTLVYPPYGASPAVMAYLGEWFALAAAMAMVVRGFFKNATLKRIALFVMPVYCVINVVFAPSVVSVSMGAGLAEAIAAGGSQETISEIIRNGFNTVTVSSAEYMVESGLILALTVYYWATAIIRKDIPLFDGWRSVMAFVACIVFGTLAAMPNYWWQFLFGASNRGASAIKSFRLYHRFIIYGGILLPIIAYFAVRHKESDVIRCLLIYFTLTAMFVYCYTQNFADLIKNPTSWPLHLCNTAMFLLPICLVFKTKKLFYFTYFINVYGALMAMLMPNYSDTTSITADSIFRFWYNHYYAFYMPLLIVALKQFERPTKKQFRYSIVGFCMYFVLVMVLNVVLRGFGYDSDYFFLAGDHIASTLGNWAENIYDLNITFDIGGHTFMLRPLYQGLFFLIYIAIGFGMWFIYELGFSLADAHGALVEKRKKIKLDQYALMSALGERSIEEPMNDKAGVKLELKHFSKKYSTSKQYAVKDANLEVHGGEIFGFLGPNGAGKSTIIKSIVGIQPITEGAIEVCGYDCEKQPVQAKRIIGYVPDHYALYEKLTGREYINYIADIYDVSEAARNERIEKYVKMFELQGSIDNPIKTYSHGMKQKITIMAALVHDPKLWILDEPLTGLDPNSIYQVKECMKEHAARGNIVFFSSHIIDVVERICDRITIIKKGQILVTRDVADIEKECPLEDYYLKMINGENESK